MFTCTGGSYPLVSFFNDLLNDVEFNDFSYVGLVVGPLKDSVLAVVFKTEEVK